LTPFSNDNVSEAIDSDLESPLRCPPMPRAFLCLVALVVILAAAPHAANAAPITIDFEALSDGDVITNQFPGLVFSNATVLTAGGSLNDADFPPRSGSDVAFDKSGPVRIDFTSAVTSVGGYFTYAVPLTLSAFNSSNVLLGSVSSAFNANTALLGDAGSSPNEWLAFSGAGIAYVILSGDVAGGSFTLDDLTYDSEVTVAPEPATATLLLLGSAVLGYRRLRT